ELEENYRAQSPRPEGKQWDWQFLGTDLSGHGEAKLTTTREGVACACPLFWKPTSKPLFIPWSDLSDAEEVPLMPHHVRFALRKGDDHLILPRAVVACETGAASLLAALSAAGWCH